MWRAAQVTTLCPEHLGWAVQSGAIREKICCCIQHNWMQKIFLLAAINCNTMVNCLLLKASINSAQSFSTSTATFCIGRRFNCSAQIDCGQFGRWAEVLCKNRRIATNPSWDLSVKKNSELWWKIQHGWPIYFFIGQMHKNRLIQKESYKLMKRH